MSLAHLKAILGPKPKKNPILHHTWAMPHRNSSGNACR